VQHVHTVQIPNGPQLVSSAGPNTPNHVHTFVTQVGTAERIHVTTQPVGSGGNHVHRVSLPIPTDRQVWRTVTTSGAMSAGGVPDTASAEPFQQRFPNVGARVAPGFMGLNVGLGPFQLRFGLADEAPPEPGPTLVGALGSVAPLLIGMGLLGLAWYMAESR